MGAAVPMPIPSADQALRLAEPSTCAEEAHSKQQKPADECAGYSCGSEPVLSPHASSRMMTTAAALHGKVPSAAAALPPENAHVESPAMPCNSTQVDASAQALSDVSEVRLDNTELCEQPFLDLGALIVTAP